MSFIHLHLHTHYSLLDSTINPSKLFPYLKEHKMEACAITDHGTLSGTYEFWRFGKEYGIKPILGIEGYVTDSLDKESPRYHIVLLAKNQEGFSELTRLSSRSFTEGMYRKPRILKQWLYEAYNRSKGLICCSACIGGDIQTAIGKSEMKLATQLATEYKNIFGEDFYLELQDLNFENQDKINEGMLELSNNLNIKHIWTNDCHFLKEDEWESRKLLYSIMKKKKLEEIEYDDAFKDLWVKPPESMKYTEAIGEINSKVKEFDLNRVMNLPDYPNSRNELIKLARFGLNKRGQWNNEYRARLKYELEIIIEKGYDGYYMIVFDFVRWAKRNGVIVNDGRGSGAGSLVAYCLGITGVDPIRHDLLFERFLNPMRESAPDFDIDFDKEGRQSVIDYVTNKYGKDHVAQISTFGYFGGKGMIHDGMRAIGVDYSKTLDVCKKIKGDNVTEWMDTQKDQDIIDCNRLCKMIDGGIRFNGVHAAGLVISNDTITKTTPCKTVKGAVVTQYEKDTLEKCGLIKFDFLGLITLSVIKEVLNYINYGYNEPRTLYGVKMTYNGLPINHDGVFEHLSFGGTMGIFQCESRGITKLFEDIKPAKFSEVADIISLYRPGCLQSGMTEKYVNAKKTGNCATTYDAIRHITTETQGVLIYQEQIMRIFMDLADYTLGQADLIRRAIGKKKLDEMEKHKKYFIFKASRYMNKSEAECLWNDIVQFADYCFNKCVTGDTKIVKGRNGKKEYTVAEMYKIMNDKRYPRRDKLNPIQCKYQNNGYGSCWSLNEDGRIRRNKIVDIRYIGKRKVYEMILENGMSIKCTDNHKFPTSNGEKRLDEINIDKDMIFVSCGYDVSDTSYRFTKSNNKYHSDKYLFKYELNSQKGHEGFVHKDTQHTRLKYYKNNLKKSECEICGSKDNLEVHHIDGEHGNNDYSNLQMLCSSCHKKEHYNMGRIRHGEKGLLSKLIKIKSISYICEDDVYDVEVDGPNHNFLANNGIITSNSHAVAYAALTMKTGFLKIFFPKYFWCAQLNSEITNKNQYKKYINYCKKAKYTFSKPNINTSRMQHWPSIKNGDSFITGLSAIPGLGVKMATAIIDERKNGRFKDYHEFRERMNGTTINTKTLTALYNAGAFDGFNEDNLEELSLLSQKKYFKRFPQTSIAEDSSS